MTQTKNKILIGISKRGTVQSARELELIAGTDEHNLVHILHSLKKQGLIGFKVDRRGRVNEPRRITLTPRGEQEIRKQA